MNERIKELAEQAFRYSCEFAQDPNYSPHNPYNGLIEKERYDKKFAQLIVRECIDIAINASSDTNFITGISEADKRALSIAVEIRNHFGVEE